jgi:hypothetical protein
VRDERTRLAEAETGGRVIPAVEVREGDKFFGVLSGRWDREGIAVSHVAKDLNGRVRITLAHSETRTYEPQRKVVVA